MIYINKNTETVIVPRVNQTLQQNRIVVTNQITNRTYELSLTDISTDKFVYEYNNPVRGSVKGYEGSYDYKIMHDDIVLSSGIVVVESEAPNKNTTDKVEYQYTQNIVQYTPDIEYVPVIDRVKDITENGTYNVENFDKVNVEVANAADCGEIIDNLQNQINTLEAEKQTLETQKQVLEEEIKGATANIEELNGQVEYLNNEITILNNKINTLTNEKKELQRQLNNINYKYNELVNGIYYYEYPDEWTRLHSTLIDDNYKNLFYSEDNTNEKRVVINISLLDYESAAYIDFKDCIVVDENGKTYRSGDSVDEANKLTFTFTGNSFSFEFNEQVAGFGSEMYIEELDKTITKIYTKQLDFMTSPKITLTDCPTDRLDIYVLPFYSYNWDGDQYIDNEQPYWGEQNQISKNGRTATIYPIFSINGASNPCGSVIESLSGELTKLEGEKIALQEEIYNKDREIQTLNTEILNLNNRINSLILEKGELQNTIYNLNSELSTKQQEISNLYDQLDDLNNTINALTEENLILQNLNQSLQNELITVYENGYNEGKTDGIVQGKEDQKALLENIVITQNGTYDNENGYNVIEVNVNVPSEESYEEGYNQGKEDQKALLENIVITQNGTYKNDNGYDQVEVNVPSEGSYEEGYNAGITYQKTLLQKVTFTENGIYDRENGYNRVIVNVPIMEDSYNYGYAEGYNKGKTDGIVQGKEDQKALLENITVTENGLYTNDNGYAQVYVKVDCEVSYEEGYNQGKTDGIVQGKEDQKALLENLVITENGTYDNENGYNVIEVNVPTQTIAQTQYITQAAYNSLSVKENNVFYLING